MLRRTFHDNLEDSRQNTILQNNLEHTLRFFLSIYVIPALRFNDAKVIQKVKNTFRTKIVQRYSATSYSIGAGYIEQLVGKDNEKTASLSTNVKDKEILSSLNQKYNDQFWSLIDSFNNMQRTENRKGYQIVAGEKEKLASEMASTICWTSFNQGIKNRGIEYNDEIKKLGLETIAGIIRDVRTKDLIKKKQLILTRRLDKDNKEKLSQFLPVSMPDFESFLRTREELRSDIVFVLITQKDERVCPVCRDLELDTWHSGDFDLPEPPVHPNCRCRLALAESEFLEEE